MTTEAQHRRQRRRVEPVSEEFDPSEIYDPRSRSQPGKALVLATGAVLSVVGMLGWMRLLYGVPLPLPEEILWSHLITDFGLLLLFLIPHSLLARGFGRRWLNYPFGPEAERPLYVFVTGITLCCLVFAWRDCGPLLWDLSGIPKILAQSVQMTGLILLIWGTLVLGLENVFGFTHLRAMSSGRQAPSAELVALPPYRWTRHPMSLGMLLMMLGMHEMTLDRGLLLIVLAAWILLVTPLEERDAELAFGQAYRNYKESTPRWLPRWHPPQDST